MVDVSGELIHDLEAERPVPQPRRRPPAADHHHRSHRHHRARTGTGPPGQPWTQKNQPSAPDPNRPPTRREKICQIMTSEPRRDWSGKELADRLGAPPRNMLTQLAEWTRLGFLAKTGPGRYALSESPGQATALAGP